RTAIAAALDHQDGIAALGEHGGQPWKRPLLALVSRARTMVVDDRRKRCVAGRFVEIRLDAEVSAVEEHVRIGRSRDLPCGERGQKRGDRAKRHQKITRRPRWIARGGCTAAVRRDVGPVTGNSSTSFAVLRTL